MAHPPASMNGPRSKGRPRSFDRAKALEAALRTFWKLGYEPASVPELCSAMGVNPPSMYAAFGSKAALFIEAMEHYERSYWDEPGRRFLAEPDLSKKNRGRGAARCKARNVELKERMFDSASKNEPVSEQQFKAVTYVDKEWAEEYKKQFGEEPSFF